MRDGQLLPLLRLEVVLVMRVKREVDGVARFAVFVDLSRYRAFEQLGALEAERTVDEVVLIVHDYEQPFHGSPPPQKSVSTYS